MSDDTHTLSFGWILVVIFVAMVIGGGALLTYLLIQHDRQQMAEDAFIACVNSHLRNCDDYSWPAGRDACFNDALAACGGNPANMSQGAGNHYGCPGCPSGFEDFYQDMCSRSKPGTIISDGKNEKRCV